MSTAELQPPWRAVDGRLTAVSTETGLALSGEIDLTSWSMLADALRRAVATTGEDGEIVLDLGGLSFIDGHGVAMIAGAARQLGPSQRIVLRQAPAALVRIAQILCLDRQPSLVFEERGRHEPA